ncbi:SRPBCC domain-containing protein [Candidatus Sodalis endolongispinus]|uniref:SRPBCC domain-containing protein n=1 Tax=Candidatus Sodalis endolongispinus TaxID=2812662 RepID=A0ABS5Y8K2_9GAMM|nr:SRPBCC domain-containing protein [Candidatus Sodalis endolongispinus]MBT9431308.1 SRPBCC domain-containing protein [Candidatus Sodalis endolongispinus]
MNAIIWPAQYQPGFCDNFVSSETIEAGLGAAEVWPWLNDAVRWPDYYTNAANVYLYDQAGPALASGVRFYFETFGFTVEAQVVEQVAPGSGQPGRLAWHGWSGEGETRLDVHHAWLIEDLPGGRVRVLTQETQNGTPAVALARTRPNPMLNGHQTWLDGLAAAARRGRQISL